MREFVDFLKVQMGLELELLRREKGVGRILKE